MPCRFSVWTFNYICPVGTLYELLILNVLTVQCTDLYFYIHSRSTARTCYSICHVGTMYKLLIMYALSVHCAEI